MKNVIMKWYKFFINFLAILFASHLYAMEQNEFITALENIFKDKKIVFIPIVSNEGTLDDPLSPIIKKHGWTCVLSESSYHLLQKIKVSHLNHSEKKTILELFSNFANSEWDEVSISVEQFSSSHPHHIYYNFSPEIQIASSSQELPVPQSVSINDLIQFDAEGDETQITITIDYSCFDF